MVKRTQRELVHSYDEGIVRAKGVVFQVHSNFGGRGSVRDRTKTYERWCRRKSMADLPRQRIKFRVSEPLLAKSVGRCVSRFGSGRIRMLLVRYAVA